jgi:NTE family protein
MADTDATNNIPAPPQPGTALCLSGGGYRAMVFHLGALWRLNEAGLLPRLNRITSVSGGSITSAILALAWPKLQFGDDGVAANFNLVVDAVRGLARITIDEGAVIFGLLSPGSINDHVVSAYDQHAFHGATLQDLPAETPGKAPRFIFLATSVQTGALWRFERPYMGDYIVGLFADPTISLAAAVGASSAFPPILSPAVLNLKQPVQPTPGATLHYPPYTTEVTLSDGGVYDNLGLEQAFKEYQTVLVSDGGQKMSPDPSPAHDWARHSIRILDIIDNQVRSLRKRILIDAYQAAQRTGGYWGIATQYANYQLAQDPLGAANRNPTYLAAIPTRLQKMADDQQERLINWGYTVCDAALRKHWNGLYGLVIKPPVGFPYDQGY